MNELVRESLEKLMSSQHGGLSYFEKHHAEHGDSGWKARVIINNEGKILFVGSYQQRTTDGHVGTLHVGKKREILAYSFAFPDLIPEYAKRAFEETVDVYNRGKKEGKEGFATAAHISHVSS